MLTLWSPLICPLAGFLILALASRSLSKFSISLIAVGSIALSFLFSCFLGYSLLSSPHPRIEPLWTWINLNSVQVYFDLYLDSLSLVMILVVSSVSLLVHLYSTQYMAHEKDYGRFFAYMNLFVFSMLLLVLSDNLLLLYLGWEGVGLCSYLLIGFWYEEPANCRAANKAFIITRIGDTFLLIGLILLFWQFGTLQVSDLLRLAPSTWTEGDVMATTVTLLLLVGAIGKSAQLPLQTWLPDAMAGPTPVSALIHAATMIAAGVYLIARTHSLFDLAYTVKVITAVIGAITLLLASFAALTQIDIKKIVAYSTMSQVGYMFLALGVGNWSLAIFHFMVHAFFKSLLFLCAGAVILALNKEQLITKMGGLWRSLPLTCITFFIGCLSLAALPWIDAGFYSKEPILEAAYSFPSGGYYLYLLSLIGAFITPLYAFRMFFLVFFGPCQQKPSLRPGLAMTLPMVLLSLLALFGGLFDIPRFLGQEEPVPNVLVQWISSFITVSSLCIAIVLFWVFPKHSHRILSSPIGGFISSGWGFDALYDRLMIRPFIQLSQWMRSDPFSLLTLLIPTLCSHCQSALALLQSGKLRWYATGMVIGAILVLSIMVLGWS